jgi:hypothetical protein
MRSVPKQLIIDKDVFRGTSTSKLKEFVQNHFVILPRILYDEIVTTQEERDKLVERFRSVVLAGRYICPASGYIIRKEAENLRPYGSLPDDKRTTSLRKILENKEEFLSRSEIGQIQDEMDKTAKMFGDFAKILSDNLTEELKNGFRKLSDFNTQNRVIGLMELVDDNDIHDIAMVTMGHLTKGPSSFCLDKNWVSWQYVRLRLLLHYEQLFKVQISRNISLEKVEHDCMDMEYVLLLSRADGLLTWDERLVKPLSEAAFPNKDVFSSLDEVPEEYICNWS